MLVNRVHKPYLCKICKKTTGVKICKCQKAFYCSRNCQKIDWNSHRSDCYFKLVEYPVAQNTATTINNNNEASCASHSSMHQTHSHETAAIREGRKEYDPTPLQYQQSNATYSHNLSCTTATIASAVNDFDENLFNLMSAVVDESTDEFLKNLNLRTDDFLSAYSLDSENVTTAPHIFKEYVPIEGTLEQDQLSDKIFDQPENQQLLQETKDNLEKELSLFRESQQLINTMQISSANPKYVNHATVQDNIMMR